MPPTPLAGAAKIDVGGGRSVVIGSPAPLPADSVGPGSIFLTLGGWSSLPDAAYYTLGGANRGPRQLMAQLGGASRVRAYKITFASNASLQDALDWFRPMVGAPDSLGERHAKWRRNGWNLLVVYTPQGADLAGTYAWLFADNVPGPTDSGGIAPTNLKPWEQCAALGFNDCRL